MLIAAPSLLLNAGIRKARLSDVDAVQSLLQTLEKEGVLVKRSRNELEAMMHDFIVIERETKVSVCGNGVGGSALAFSTLCAEWNWARYCCLLCTW